MSFDKVLTTVFGSSNERFLKGIRPLIARINELEPEIKKLSDEKLRERTAFFKAQVADAVRDARDKDDRKHREQEALNEILPEAFAIVREGSVRTTGMRHFDVQLIGGVVLHHNMNFDLATCVQPGHYYAIVDEVDSILIGEARTPLIISGPFEESTDKYYQANAIIPQLQRGEELAEGQKTGDYIVDEKNHSAVLTEEGVDKAERLLGVGNLYDPSNMELLHCVEQALKAHTLYRLDHQYVVQDGEVIIVDDFTGRLMKGRRWSDGLHQAVEAKEGVKIERENQTLATITLQNYFRLYEKLSGMTGTAETEAGEFHSTYKLEVIVIPTHMPMVRKDNPDMIYRTLPEKWDAVVEEIQERYENGQPVLVGTVSVENSELIARRLQRVSVPHNVLNAKYHEREAEIVAQAGRKGAITIATNRAGRGTEILLGGNPDFMTREFLKEEEIDPDEANESQWQEKYARAKRIVESEHKEVVSLGGLHILGTERHESRRIDNQLRGRAGRQGDPGSSRFFLSLEDDVMRILAGDKVKALMQRLGMEA